MSQQRQKRQQNQEQDSQGKLSNIYSSGYGQVQQQKKALTESVVSKGSSTRSPQRQQDQFQGATILKINRLASQNSIRTNETPSSKQQKNTLDGFNLVQGGTQQQVSRNLLISKFGLQMEPICQKKGHDRGKIIFICTDPEIQGKERTGCAVCMLEQFKDKSHQIIKIDDFVESIKERYSEYYDSLRDLKDFSSELESPQFLSVIDENIDQLTKIFAEKIEDIKRSILAQFKSEVSQDYLQFSNLVRNQKHFSSQIEMSIQKNFLNLNPEDLDGLIELLHQAPVKQIEVFAERVKSKMSQTEKNFMLGSDNLINNLNSQINHIMTHYDQIQIPLNLDDRSILRLDLIQRKEAKEKLLIDTEKLNKEIQELKKQIYEIEKDMGMHIKPHSHPQEDFITTVPIFECCQQAFKCYQCHDNYSKDHKAYLTNPSKRYCMQCQRIFTVLAYSDTPVPCIACQSRIVNNIL